jgi:FkbM family methyltransferase
VLASLFVGRAGRVWAIEPQPDSVRLLRANLWRHNVRGAVLALAAMQQRGHVVIMSSEKGRSSSWVGVEGDLMVPAAPLDDLIHGRADVVKIDTEGYDHVALQGLEQTLTRNPDVFVVVEFWPSVPHFHDGSTPAQVLDLYSSMGFCAFLLDDGDPAPASWEEVLHCRPDGGYVNVGLARSADVVRRLRAASG